MSNAEVSMKLESIKAQKGLINFSKELTQEILNEEALTAAEILYEMANGEGKKTAKNLRKRKGVEVGSSDSPDKNFKRLSAVCNTTIRNNYRAHSLCNKVIPSKNELDLLLPRQQPTTMSKSVRVSAETSYCAETSFSIKHLLSAVRLVLITPYPLESDFYVGSSSDCSTEESYNKRLESAVWSREYIKMNLPSLSIDQIVQRLRSRPGDSRILECEEPLEELVRGVLKIFVSEGIYWKPLTMYDILTRKWRWTGPLPHSLTHKNFNEVNFSPLAWRLPREILITLNEKFSIWLGRMRSRLHLMASLPPLPLQFMKPNDFQTRFSDRKKLNQVTIGIGHSCPEMRAYFHREESIRYLIIENSFKYTRMDSAKSSVAPLRKIYETALPRSHGHRILKDSIPPKFSLLSLVRDASARLPGGVGTRADICALVRDSQYIVDDVPEKTVKQIVSGALDRLHYEVDPCVKYEREWGLWVYLHGDREEEDFRDNGTSSLKIKKKGKECTVSNSAQDYFRVTFNL